MQTITRLSWLILLFIGFHAHTLYGQTQYGQTEYGQTEYGQGVQGVAHAEKNTTIEDVTPKENKTSKRKKYTIAGRINRTNLKHRWIVVNESIYRIGKTTQINLLNQLKGSLNTLQPGMHVEIKSHIINGKSMAYQVNQLLPDLIGQDER